MKLIQLHESQNNGLCYIQTTSNRNAPRKEVPSIMPVNISFIQDGSLCVTVCNDWEEQREIVERFAEDVVVDAIDSKEGALFADCGPCELTLLLSVDERVELLKSGESSPEEVASISTKLKEMAQQLDDAIAEQTKI